MGEKQTRDEICKKWWKEFMQNICTLIQQLNMQSKEKKIKRLVDALLKNKKERKTVCLHS